jgi:hypothetical protein
MCGYSRVSSDGVVDCSSCSDFVNQPISARYVLMGDVVYFPSDSPPNGGLFYLWDCPYCKLKNVSFFAYYLLCLFTSPVI